MQIILLEKIANLGDLGDTVNVKAGHGRNYLIPGGHALPATESNVAEFESRRAELEAAAADKLTASKSFTLHHCELSLSRRVANGNKEKGCISVYYGFGAI